MINISNEKKYAYQNDKQIGRFGQGGRITPVVEITQAPRS